MNDKFKPMEVPVTKAQKLALKALHEQVEITRAAFYEASRAMKNAQESFWENAKEMGLSDDTFLYQWRPRENKLWCVGLNIQMRRHEL